MLSLIRAPCICGQGTAARVLSVGNIATLCDNMGMSRCSASTNTIIIVASTAAALMRQSILLACLVGPAACSPDTTNAAEDDAVRALKLKLWQKGKECHECRSTSDFEAAVAHARFNPVWHLRGGCDEKEMHCGVQAPALDMLVAKLGPAFGKVAMMQLPPPPRRHLATTATATATAAATTAAAAAAAAAHRTPCSQAIDDNIADHAKDCAKSCETFYCGPGPKRTLESTHFANYSMGDVPPEDFSSDFRFPLDLIKVTGDAHPLFTREECAAVVATAESEDVHLNEYVSGKYKLGGDWMYNLPKTLEWFNRNLKEKIFPTLAVLFPEVISGPEVLRAHSVAMLKYNNTHPRTDVHVDNGVIALTLALSPSENYEGGGTFFEHMGDEPLQMDAGHATFRPGSVRHGGHTVTRGERYIIGAFILIEDKVEHVRRLNGRGRDARNRNTKEASIVPSHSLT